MVNSFRELGKSVDESKAFESKCLARYIECLDRANNMRLVGSSADQDVAYLDLGIATVNLENSKATAATDLQLLVEAVGFIS